VPKPAGQFEIGSRLDHSSRGADISCANLGVEVLSAIDCELSKQGDPIRGNVTSVERHGKFLLLELIL
jgi:hypothetical protein